MKRRGCLSSSIDRIGATLASVHSACTNGLTRSLVALLFARPRKFDRNQEGNIVVFRVGNIGDTLTSLPALNALRARFPRARITLLSSPGSRIAVGARDLLADHPSIDELCIYYADDVQTPPGRRQLLDRVRALEPKLFVDLSPALQSLRSAVRTILFAKLAGARHFAGAQVPMSNWFQRAQARRQTKPYDARRLLDLLRPLGIDSTSEPLRFDLPVSANAERAAESFLSAKFAGVNPSTTPLIVINPGAKRATNRWPAASFGRTGRALVKERGARVVVLGAPSERDLARSVAEEIPGAVSAAGEVSLDVGAALLRAADLLVTNDTGTMHLAAALNTPQVIAFSARDLPGKWHPEGNAVLLRARPTCAGCQLDQCATPVCLDAIDVDTVLAACRVQLDAEERDRAFEASDESPPLLLAGTRSTA